jgi:uncharacterized protein
LDPSDRPDLEEYLAPEQLAIYLSMVGEDGWCINLDKDTRSCNIYDVRPSFCRVQEDTFVAMFGIEPADLNDFAIACCREQIEGVYGERSLEAIRFDQELGIFL